MVGEPNILEMHPRQKLKLIVNDGDPYIAIPKWRSDKARKLARAIHLPEHFRVHLDDYGVFVYSLCTGELTVRDIGIRVKKRFGKDAEPVLDRLIEFLYTLEASNAIEFDD